MQRGDSARELLRASATDAAAARQLLAAMDADELDGLLDGISRRDSGKKAQTDVGSGADNQSREDWLALAHALLQCDNTRLRAATRVVQVLWTGAASELEAMQLLTELALGYALALDDAGDKRGAGRQLLRLKLRNEVNLLLDATYRLVGEAVADKELRAKALPQLLGLVPSLLGLLAELTSDEAANPTDEDAVHEKLVGLLELPWTVRTLPFLLDALKDSSGFVSPAGWQLLQENVRRMVSTSAQMPAESMNLVMRECVSVAGVTNSTQWIDIARFLLRRLPVQSRQEAEFNLQMCLHQSQSLVDLVTLAIHDATTSSGDPSLEQPEQVDLDTKADWHDLIFLLHALQASKPILHHRSSSLRVARESAVFKDIEDLAWRICVDDLDRGGTASHGLLPTQMTYSQPDDRAVEAHMNDRVSKIINFGGKQAYAREWKALLLMDVALYWVDQTSSALIHDSSTKEIQGDCRTKRNLSKLVLLAIFYKAPEAQNEILRSLFERCQQPHTAKVSSEILRKLFGSHPQNLHCHLNAIQDWLGVHFHSSFQSAEEVFVIASRLSMHHRGLFNFLMVFLRKLLSTNNRPHQQFAINLWCTWLESGFRFDEQQEEEILAAIKSGFVVCATIRPWSMGRLEQVFRCNTPLQLRPASQADLHQFLYHEVGRFVQPTARHQRSNIHSDDESESEDEDEHPSGLRFDFCSLDEFYLQDSTPQGAATAGELFHRALSCLLAFERVAPTLPGTERSLSSTGGEEGTAIRRWVAVFVSNQDLFFHWMCRSTEQPSGALSKRSVWNFLARMFIASALCTVTTDLMLEQHHAELQGAPSKTSIPKAISIWSVMEMEFCVHRMIRKTIQESEKKMAWAVPRTFSSTLHFGLARTLRPHASTLLVLLRQAVTSRSEPQEASSKGPSNSASGISFDEFVFVLDLFTHSGVNVNKQSSRNQRSTSDDQDNKAVLETLLLLYRELADRLHAQASLQLPPTSSMISDGDRLEDATHVPSMVFAVYIETMAMKVPAALRYLTVAGGSTAGAVILDEKTGDELLGRICAALGKTVTTLIQSSSAADVQQELFVLLQTSCWSSVVMKDEYGSVASGSSFVALARALLGDIQFLLESGELTKWSIGAATLCKRLCDVPGALIDATARDELSGQAAQILCDHVVHQVPLLRLLLAISFLSLPFQFADGDSEPVVNLLRNTLRACGFSPSFDHAEDSSSTLSDSLLLTGSKRKRLRQSADSSEMSDADSDADIFPSSRSGHIPHLVSSAAQNVALGAVITLVDRFSLSLVSSLGWGNRPAKSTPSQHRQMASVLVGVLDLLRRTIYTSRDLSWIMAKVLLQTLSIVETTLRIGNNCARMSGAKDEATASAHAVEVFDCTVRCAAQSRRWIAWVKEASSDSSSKTRLSATALKVDIFLLKVPTKAQALLKKKIPRESVNRLKSLVLMVKSNISTTHQETEQPRQGKAKARFVDVVPIVRKRRKRLRSRHPIIDAFLHEEDGDDAYADLEDFIE